MAALESADGVWELRDYDPAAVIALNNAEAEKTSVLDERSFDGLLAVASFAKGYGEAPEAMLIAMTEAAPYDNPNFAWFKAQHPRFVYIDRVVVAESACGQGLARRLYEALFAFAKARDCAMIGCEVNIEPPNPGSDLFHAAMGFAEAGQAKLSNGKTVRYLLKRMS